MASVLAVVGIATLWRFSFTEARANAFVDMAVATHRNQEAVDWLRKSTRLKPKLSSSWKNLGLAYERLGDPDNAKAAFDRASALSNTVPSTTGH